MPTLAAYDGAELAYHVLGDGTPMVCLPGGPMQDSAYLGNFGGLSERLRLILVDARGTGQSPHRQTPPPTAAIVWLTTSRRCATTSASPG